MPCQPSARQVEYQPRPAGWGPNETDVEQWHGFSV